MSDPRAQIAAARAAWPGVDLADDIYLAWLAERAGRAARQPTRHATQPPALHTTDLYLACACVHGVPRAVETFEAQLMSRVPAFLARMKPSATLIDEVSQRLRERLLMPAAGRAPRLAEYSGRGPLSAWLCVAAVRTAVDVLRSPADRTTELDTAMIGDDDPELAYLKDRYRREVDEALRAGMRALSHQQRAVLRLIAEDGLTLDEIGAMYRVAKSTVFRWLGDARHQLVSEARRFLQDKLGISHGEFASLVNLVRSQLDISLRGVLTGTRDRA